MERDEYIAVKNSLVNDFRKFQNDMDSVVDYNCLEMQDISSNMSYLKICGVDTTGDEKNLQLVNALYNLNISFSFIIRVIRGELILYIGCKDCNIEIVKGLLCRLCGAKISESMSNRMVFKKEFDCTGILIGDVEFNKDSKDADSALDQLLRYHLEEDYAIVISCNPLSKKISNNYLEAWEHLGSQVEQLISRQTTIRDERETVSFSDVNNALVRYRELTKKNIAKFEQSINEGLFNCSIKLYAEKKSTCEIIAGILMANNRQEKFPVPIHRLIFKEKMAFNDKHIMNVKNHIIGDRSFILPVFSNMYVSEEVAYFVRLPLQDTVGFERNQIPLFEVSRCNKDGLLIGNIIRQNTSVGEYYLPFVDMNRHIFVPGMTGSGKTNTLKYLLTELYKMKIPWMCIEPAKAEYFSLYKCGIDSLKIIVAGSKDNPLYINPFEPVNKEVSLQTHIDSLYAALLSSFTWVSPLPYVLENCLYRVYEECGFDLENLENNTGLNQYPTIELLYFIIPIVVKEMGYDGRMEHDIISSLQSRISTLRRGTKGDILNVKKSMQIEELFEIPTIIELENIGDNDTKSFVMSLLMMLLREYRMNKSDSQLRVKHFLLIEEAHRLLKNTSSNNGENGDPKENGVRFFTDMINELRSKGQGFIIADQIPEQLAPAILKNTNLKICHRLVAGSDAKLVGDSIHASEEQISYMCNLKRGEAEVFSEGDNSPKLVKIPNMNEKVLRDREDITRNIILNLCKYHSVTPKIKQMNRSVGCLICHKSDCPSSFINDEILISLERDFLEIKTDSEFEDFCLKLAVLLKREDSFGSFFCILAKLFEKHKINKDKEFYYLEIAKEIVE